MSLDRNLAVRIYARDGWRCRHCKSVGPLHPHHIIFASQGGSDESNNLITLCFQCHRALHDGFLRLKVYAKLAEDNKVKFKRLRGWMPQ